MSSKWDPNVKYLLDESSHGKVRDIYKSVDGKTIALVASDRVSAFDKVLPNGIEGKGKILTKISAFWFKQTKDIMPNALITIDEMPPDFQRPEFEGRVTIMKKLRMLPIEAIVRGHITGSLWKAYQEGLRDFCGIGLPDCLQNSDRLPEPIFTPTTKAPQGEHDENINFNDIVDILEQAGFDNPAVLGESVRHCSLQLYNFAYEFALIRDIIIADTKFEFGIDEFGTLYVADELLTPDSSRFWPESDYEPGRDQPSMDKQIIRDYVAAHKDDDPFEIPAELLEKALAQYEKCYEMLKTP